MQEAAKCTSGRNEWMSIAARWIIQSRRVQSAEIKLHAQAAGAVHGYAVSLAERACVVVVVEVQVDLLAAIRVTEDFVCICRAH